MRSFVDTSSLFKKYFEEKGSEEFDRLLGGVSELIVSPVTVLEIHSIIERRLREKSLTPADARWVEKEFMIDYDYFGVVEWSEALLHECVRLIRKYQLRVLDSIQLASAAIADISLFIVSDKRLYAAAHKELRNVRFV